MAITDTTTRLVFQRKIAEYLGFYEYGTAETNAGNSTTKMYDDSVDSFIKSGRLGDNRHVDKWLYVHTGTNNGSARQVQQQDMSEGHLTVDRAMASAFTNSSEYHIYGYRPELIQNAIDRALARCYHEDWLLVTLLDDGDMRDSGVTNWAAILSPTTRAKVTNVQDRYMGPQAIQLINDAANEGVVSNQIYVTANESFRVEAVGRVQAGVADLIAYDNTGSKEIDAQNTTEISPNRDGGLFRLAFDFTIPASCEDWNLATRSAFLRSCSASARPATAASRSRVISTVLTASATVLTISTTTPAAVTARCRRAHFITRSAMGGRLA